MKAAETGPRVLTLTLAIPLSKESGLVPGGRMTTESQTLWIQASTSTTLNSLLEGRSRQLDLGYAHILVLCL
jgi:hypothetical protein